MFAPAVGAEPTKAPSAERAPGNCVVLIDRVDENTGESRELFSTCAPTIEEAQAQLFSPSTQSRIASTGAVALASAPIMEWWKDLNYTGERTIVYGAAGPCDWAGYNMNPSSYWAANITSIRGYGSCTKADLAGRYNTGFLNGAWLPIGYVGAALNDNVGYVHTYQG